MLLPSPSWKPPACLQDAQSHLSVMLFPNKARLMLFFWVPTAPRSHLPRGTINLITAPALTAPGSRRSQILFLPPRDLKLMRTWGQGNAVIAASMDLFSAYFVSVFGLRPFAHFTLFHTHSNPTRWVPLSPYFTDKEADAQRIWQRPYHCVNSNRDSTPMWIWVHALSHGASFTPGDLGLGLALGWKSGQGENREGLGTSGKKEKLVHSE